MQKSLLFVLFQFTMFYAFGQSFSKGYVGSPYTSVFSNLYEYKSQISSIGFFTTSNSDPGLLAHFRFRKNGTLIKAISYKPMVGGGIGKVRLGNDIYVLNIDNSFGSQSKPSFLQVDSNGNLLKCKRFDKLFMAAQLLTGKKSVKNKILCFGNTSQESGSKGIIGLFDKNLNLMQSKIISGPLTRSSSISRVMIADSSIYILFTNIQTNGIGLQGIAELDTALNFKRAGVVPLGLNISDFFNNVYTMFTLPDKSMVFEGFSNNFGNFNSNLFLFTDKLDSIQQMSYLPVKNPLLDTLPFIASGGNSGQINFSDGMGNLYYQRSLTYTDALGNFGPRIDFFGSFNLITKRQKQYRLKQSFQGFNYFLPEGNLFTNGYLLGLGFTGKGEDARGFSIHQNPDTLGCIGIKDSLRVRYGPKSAFSNYIIQLKDTLLSSTDVQLTTDSIPLCEMDYCNPISYGGLGPDITTCQDSVVLQGQVVYPGQKLQWSNGDTTMQTKVKTGQSHHITISGYCGTFRDTIQIIQTPKPFLDLVPEQDSLTTCTPRGLFAASGQFVNPRWLTPKGVIQGSGEIQADTTGYYIIENDPNGCSNRDSIFISFKTPVLPVLPFGDSLKSCSPIDLFSSVSGDISWETPLGIVNTDTVKANLTGKYVIRNQVLSCQARDSVFVVFRNPYPVSINPNLDSFEICKPSSLSTVSTQFVNPFWRSPKGPIAGSGNVVADTTGYYVIINDPNECPTKDSIFVRYQEPNIPILPFGDTIRSCFAVNLFTNVEGNLSWELPGGAVIFSPSIEASQTGKYIIRNQLLDCRTQDSVYLKFRNPYIVTTLPNDDTLRLCKTIELRANTMLNNGLYWQLPNGQTVNNLNVLITESGLYKVVNDTGRCLNSDSIYVFYEDLKKPDLGLPSAVESCKANLLVSNIESANQSWETPLGAQTGKEVNATLSGKYVVKNQRLDCNYRDSVFFTLRSPKLVRLEPSENTIVTCKKVNLTAFSSDFLGLTWSTPAGKLELVNPVVAVTSGKYIVRNDTGNCLNSDSVLIRFSDTSAVNFEVREGESVIQNLNILRSETEFPFQINSITEEKAVIFRWYLNDVLVTDNSSKQNFTIGDEGNYAIRLMTISSDSCLGKAEKLLVIKKQIFPDLNIPNMVTLNEDGKNDLFEIKELTSYPENELVIYNRWGQEVYQSKPYKNNWPLKEIESGTYFYFLKAGQKSYSDYITVFK